MNNANDIYAFTNEVVEAWAALSPLWMGKQISGMKYHGANPYNMYPSEAYSTSEMYDSCWPERRNIRGIAFGHHTFSIEDISKAYCGVKKIQKENEYINPVENQ